MPGIHRLDHIDRLRPPDFSDNDPVRPHPKACLDQVPDADRPAPLHICVSRLHLHEVRNVTDLQLGGVLDRDHSLPRINAVRQDIEEGGLSRACAATDENIEPRPDAPAEKLCDLF